MHWAEGLQDNENCRGSGQLSGKFCSSRLSKWGYSLSISDDFATASQENIPEHA